MPVKSTAAPEQLPDPLSALMAPSEFETPEERVRRLEQEEEAKRVSNAIDDELNRERKAPKPVKILLLGSPPQWIYSSDDGAKTMFVL